MIRITIYTDGGHAYKGFDVSGHAEFSDSGRDIICSAVSILVINTVNALEAYTEDRTEVYSDPVSGCIRFRFAGSPSHDAELLVKTMVLGLISIEENMEYEPYIDIIFKEV